MPFRALAVFLSLVFTSQSSFAEKKMYRWVDENGKVTFSDVVPPDQVKFKRETLNENARVLDVVDRAKTAEEIAEQKHLQALRKEQERIIAKQAAEDKVLLSTYRSLDDINHALQNKLAGLEAEQKVVYGNLERAKQQLGQQQQQAAELERNERKVPEKLLAEITGSKQQVASVTKELERYHELKQQVEQQFKIDAKRLEVLLAQSVNLDRDNNEHPDTLPGNSVGLYVCEKPELCNQAWKIAAEFAEKYSTTGADVESDKLIMRAAPSKDNDISLSVSKLVDASGLLQLFLDIRCKQSMLGNELCASSTVQDIRKGFAPYIKAKLAAQQ